MIVIFDLDYTLLDLDPLMRKAAGTLNMSLRDYRSSANVFLKEKGINFNMYRHISALLREGMITREQADRAKREIPLLMKNIDEHIFPGVPQLLEELIAEGFDLRLVTFGDYVWQGEKVKNMSSRKYFSSITITDKPKEIALEFLKKENRDILIVNDNAMETKNILEKLEEAQAVLINGPMTDNCDHNLPVIMPEEIKNIMEYVNR